MSFKYALTDHDGRSTLTAYNPEAEVPLKTVDSTHPHFDEILEGVREGDSDVWELFDVAKGVMAKFAQVTDRVSWNGSEVLFDGDPVHNVLTAQLARAIGEGKEANYLALARFWEKLESNPDENSRTQAYDFLASHAFQITAEGDVVAFKGVDEDGQGGHRSRRSSEKSGIPSAYVDGQPVPPLSQVPNNIGTEVSMPRAEVSNDPNKSCERGLHISTYDYARSWGTVVVEVHANPRDIVSVPNHEASKVRVHRYTVARVALQKDSYGESTVLSPGSSATTWAGDVGYRV